jgi:hypothetical protein
MNTPVGPGDGIPHEQHNHGPGLFVGRDMYKFETIDENTKAVLVRLGKEAPALGKLVNQALRDGMISPEAVAVLARAARNINEDVANSLRHASRSINEDVANSLNFAAQSINEDVARSLGRSAENINEEVARQIDHASTKLSSSVGDIEDVLRRFQMVSGALKSANSNLEEWENVAEAMDVAAQNMGISAQRYSSSRSGWSWKAFWWGFSFCFLGLIVILTLMNSVSKV